MLGLLDFVVGIFDLVVYWRVGLGVALTGLACFLLVLVIPHYPTQLIICVPVGLMGVFFSFRWQHRSE